MNPHTGHVIHTLFTGNKVHCFQVVTHPSTNKTQCSLTLLIGQEAMFPMWQCGMGNMRAELANCL